MVGKMFRSRTNADIVVQITGEKYDGRLLCKILAAYRQSFVGLETVMSRQELDKFWQETAYSIGEPSWEV